MYSHLCLSSSQRRAKTQGLLISASLTLLTGRQNHWVFFLSKPGSNQQHSSHLYPSPPSPTGCQCRQNEDTEDSTRGHGKRASKQSSPVPWVQCHPVWSLATPCWRPEGNDLQWCLWRDHVFPPLVQRTSILLSLLSEGLHNKIYNFSQYQGVSIQDSDSEE